MFSSPQAKLLAVAATTLVCVSKPLVAQSCSFAVLHESVIDANTRVPLPDAQIFVSWAGQTVRFRTDSVGKAVVCAPAGRVLSIRATFRDISSAVMTTVLDSTRTTQHTTSLDLPNVMLRGSVVDAESGSPIANVLVRIDRTSLSALTNDAGRFIFPLVPIGNYTMHTEHISFGRYEASFNALSDDLEASIRLTPAAIALAPLKVTAFSQNLERAGFYDRQKRGIGMFMGRKEIDATNAQVGSDVLRSVPSLRQQPQLARRNGPRNTTHGRGNCRYRFVVNGTRTMPDFEIDNVPAYTMEGIEIYNGLAEIPAVFRQMSEPGGATCGVIAIWTRAGR